MEVGLVQVCIISVAAHRLVSCRPPLTNPYILYGLWAYITEICEEKSSHRSCVENEFVWDESPSLVFLTHRVTVRVPVE